MGAYGIKMKDYIVTLEITSWAEKTIGKVSFKGTHFYGRMVGYRNGEQHIHYLKQHLSKDFARKLTDAEGWIYHPGALIERFETKDDIRQLAISTVKNIFPECSVLFEATNIGSRILHEFKQGE